MRNASITTLVAVLLASTTLLPAQSIDIDFGNPGATRPNDAYRGAGLPGRWNKFDATNSSVHYPLYALDGALTPATAYQIGGTVIVATPLGGAGESAGDDAILLGDVLMTCTAPAFLCGQNPSPKTEADEAAGIEPASEKVRTESSRRLVRSFFSRLNPAERRPSSTAELP